MHPPLIVGIAANVGCTLSGVSQKNRESRRRVYDG